VKLKWLNRVGLRATVRPERYHPLRLPSTDSIPPTRLIKKYARDDPRLGG
jgi:hypothetical protein